MPGRYVRSSTAHRVAQLLGSREGRTHLSQNGWRQGMPVVMAAEHELLDDIMGLVSLHAQSVLVAMLEQNSGKLMFIHVSEPNANLKTVGLYSEGRRINSFIAEVARAGSITFRVKYWKYSAVAHFVPEFRIPEDRTRTSYDRMIAT